VSVAYIAWQQWKLNKREHKASQFDKKYEIYYATAKFLADIMSFATTTKEGLANFLRDTNKSYFFYNDDINNFLSEIY
jgi:hypothetical protein